MNPLSATRPALSDRKEWLPVIELAAIEVFERMLGCTLRTVQEPPPTEAGITSMVGLAGKLCGVMSLRCHSKAAALMASKMLGSDIQNTGPEMSDALGEICNMVAGNFKNKISGLGDGCMLSPPTVIMGSDYSMRSSHDSPALELNLLFEGMPLLISLQIHS